MYNSPQYEPEALFVATYNGTKHGDNAANRQLENAFARKNAIIGVVSAQLRRRSPLIAGPINAKDSSTAALPSVNLPSPHVYVANMRVDDRMQRKGVGMALLSSVMEYASSWSEQMNEKIPIVLSVDNDNIGAIALYERVGFDYLEQNNVFRMMILWP